MSEKVDKRIFDTSKPIDVPAWIKVKRLHHNIWIVPYEIRSGYTLGEIPQNEKNHLRYITRTGASDSVLSFGGYKEDYNETWLIGVEIPNVPKNKRVVQHWEKADDTVKRLDWDDTSLYTTGYDDASEFFGDPNDTREQVETVVAASFCVDIDHGLEHISPLPKKTDVVLGEPKTDPNLTELRNKIDVIESKIKDRDTFEQEAKKDIRELYLTVQENEERSKTIREKVNRLTEITTENESQLETIKAKENEMANKDKTHSDRAVTATKHALILGAEILAGSEGVDMVLAGIEEVIGVGKREGFWGLKDSRWAELYKMARSDPKLDAILRAMIAFAIMNGAIFATKENSDGEIEGVFEWIPQFLAEVGVNASEAALGAEIARGGKVALDSVKPAFLKGVAKYRAQLAPVAQAAKAVTEKDELAKAREVQAKRQGSM